MSLRRALSFSYIEKYGSYVIGLVSTIFISRLLGPADIGAFAVGMALVGVVAVIRELGVSAYLIQERELTEERTRAAFSLTVLVGLALATLVLAMSIPVGRFYEDHRVTSVIAILALGFAITPLGSISQALMARDLQFGRLTWIRLLYATVSGAVGIALAATGFGPQSLAWATVAAALCNSVVSMALRPHSLRLNLSRNDIRRVLDVGGPATAIAIIDDLLSSMPELVLGRIQNLAAAGLFSRAKGLSQMAHQLIARAAGPVFLSAFASLERDGHVVQPLYLKATACVTVLGWALLGTLAVLAEPVIMVLYGPQWTATLPVLRWLCAAAAATLLTSGANHLLLACGGAKDVLWAKAVSMPVQLGCLVIGAFFSATAMAAATLVGCVFASALLVVAVRRRVGIGVAEQLSAFRLSAPVTLAAIVGATPALLLDVSSTWHGLLAIGVGGGGAAAAALVTLALGAHPIKEELQRALSSLRAWKAYGPRA